MCGVIDDSLKDECPRRIPDSVRTTEPINSWFRGQRGVLPLFWIPTMILRVLLPFVGLSLLLGCSNSSEERRSPHLVGGADQGEFILYGLDGDRYPGDPRPDGAEELHGWVILKTCNIDSVDQRLDLLEALERGEEEMRGSSDMARPDCFQPRHAIRIVQGDVTTDRLICFQCSNLMIWVDDVETGAGSTSDSPRRTFDAILSRCGNGD